MEKDQFVCIINKKETVMELLASTSGFLRVEKRKNEQIGY